MSKRQRIVVISAPSGAGKTTICREILKRIDKLEFSVSYTTRKKREGEIDGRDYFFVSVDEFKRMIDNNEFAEWALVHGNYYGTSKKQINDIINRGNICLLDIDVQGGKSIKGVYPDGLFIFIMPPSIKELERRLVNRHTNTKEDIRLRLENAKREMEYKDMYDYIVINDNLENAINKVIDIIKKTYNI